MRGYGCRMGPSYLQNRHSKMFRVLLFTLAVTRLALARRPSSGPPCGRMRGYGCRMGDEIQWVYCNNAWRQATESNCPVIFKDPDFSDHSMFCVDKLLQTIYPGGEIFSWDATADPQYQKCEYFPHMMCSVCTPADGES